MSNKINDIINNVLPEYGLDPAQAISDLYGSGLINITWRVVTPTNQFILQKVNTSVFENPGHVAANVKLIASHLEKHHPNYLFVSPILSKLGKDMVFKEELGCFRLFPFVPNSHSKDIVETPGQAFEAAVQFGRFTSNLTDIGVGELKMTIPDFHNLALRYNHFLEAIKNGNPDRIADAGNIITQMMQHNNIVKTYNQILHNPHFKLRVTHHDTKISNVLFSTNDIALCVIDFDTIMPGYFISDVGDMLRTYLSPVSEEESDFSKIEVREEFYKAIVQGYYNEMKGELTKVEIEHFFYAGTFMIYMQALRFLTDYLNNDIYYGAKFPKHNLVRATNQLVLLEKLLDKKATIDKLLHYNS